VKQVRTVAIGLLILGFAALIGSYMSVVNRYVHFSVRVEASRVAEPGGTVAVRLTAYRPGRLTPLGGEVSLSLIDPDGTPRLVGRDTVSSDRLSVFRVSVPEEAQGEIRLRAVVQIGNEPEPRVVDFALPVQAPESWLDNGSVRSAGVSDSDGVAVRNVQEQSQIVRVRMEPADSPFRLDLVAEGGTPVRFIENRLIVRATDAGGSPLADHTLTLTIPDSASPSTTTLVTDVHGLAEFRATPYDVEIWSIAITGHDRQRATGIFEVVPSFDGLLIRAMPITVTTGSTLYLTVTSSLSTDHYQYDLHTDGVWIESGSGTMTRDSLVLATDTPGRHALSHRIRFLLAQVVSNPFSSNPQRALTAVLVRPAGTSEIDAVTEFVAALEPLGIQRDYVAALQRAGLPRASTITPELYRLVRFLTARLKPSYQPPALAYDDTEIQEATLLAEVSAFRRRAHWLMALGTLALLIWMAARVGTLMWRTKQRTVEFLSEINDPEPGLEGAFGANAGAMGILWLVIALGTVALFCLGVILMLSYM
jgi:hypothetical protein